MDEKFFRKIYVSLELMCCNDNSLERIAINILNQLEEDSKEQIKAIDHLRQIVGVLELAHNNSKYKGCPKVGETNAANFESMQLGSLSWLCSKE